MIRRNPQRLAWSVLILSFGACLFLAVSVPLAIQSFLTYSTEPAALILEVQQGTALLQRPASADLVGVTDRTIDVPEDSVISVDDSTRAILTLRDPSGVTNLAIIQLYANTELTLEAANSPRFPASPNPHRLDLFVKGGRIRANVLNGTPRPAAVMIRSPQGEVRFATGTYAVEVSNEELQVTVRDGRAIVSAQDTSVFIEPAQRARVELGRPPQGGLSNERNLIANGNFANSSPADWVIEHGPQAENEPTGAVTFTTFVGRRAALFERRGPSHAETRLMQAIDRDVSEAASLTLHFAVLIGDHDLPVCGSLGSECPLMVKINYRDASGAEREWVQGFYSPSAPDPQKLNPPLCETCSTRNLHQPILPNAWYPYDSGNLMELLTTDAFTPEHITRITFYASGHSYRSAITDVELLVQD